jgi:hypothetical protein
MNTYYVVTYEDNWADEMDIDRHCVLNEEQYEELQKALKETNGFEFYIGTNEEIYYDDNDSIMSVIDIKKIDKTQYDVLQKLNLLSRGFASDFIDNILYSVKEK